MFVPLFFSKISTCEKSSQLTKHAKNYVIDESDVRLNLVDDKSNEKDKTSNDIIIVNR